MAGIRLIIVDDNAVLRQNVRQDLAAYGDIEIVAEAGDGVQALEIAAAQPSDVMLLDIIMPKKDGLGVLAELQTWEQAPNVLVYTSIGNDSIIAQAMDLGASYYMVKPIQSELLHRRILEVAGLKRREHTPGEQGSPLSTRWSADERVANLFLTLGIPAHIKGYQYLREAVRMVMADHDVINRITKELYPGIARRYDTSSSKVERAMRHAIEVAWNRGRLENTNQMLGVNLFTQKDKPTNGEFISLIAEKAAGK